MTTTGVPAVAARRSPAAGPGVLDVMRLPTWLLVAGGLGATALVGALAATDPVTAVLAVAALAVAVPVLMRPVLLALVAVTLVPITSGLRRGLPVPGLRLSELLVVVTAVVVLLAAARILPGPRWRWWDWVALAYCSGTAVFAVLHAVVSSVPITPEDVNVMLGPFQFLLLYRVAAAAFPTAALRALALRCILLASLPVAALAAGQILGPPAFQNAAVSLTGTTVFITPGYDPVMRATSLFQIWHALGGYVLVVTVLALALLAVRDRTVLSTPWLVTVAGAGLLTMVLTLTATVVVGLVLAVVVIGWATRRLGRVVGLVVVVGTALGLAFAPQIADRIDAQSATTSATASVEYSWLPQTIAYRLVVWTDQYVPAMQGNWAFGLGPADPPGVTWNHTESGYLTLLLRGGVVLLAVGVLLLLAFWRLGRLGWWWGSVPHDRAVSLATLALAAVIPVLIFFYPYMTSGGLPQPLWAIWGITAAAAAGLREARPGWGRPQAPSVLRAGSRETSPG